WLLACWQNDKTQIRESVDMFGDSPTHIRYPNFPKENRLDRLRREFSVLGFLCDCHPIILYTKILDQIKSVKADNLFKFVGKNIKFAGWLITGKTVLTKHGDPMKFLTFEDETGIVETVFFPKTYARFCHMIEYGRPYILTGKVDSEWGAVTLSVIKTESLSM
ncbi:MAG: DNA polymerase III subunit alpha, partial [Desulfobacteraceae bacterium]|nr:DNA polymerase III subunit alpha [Desulfobacteraceae bacterium]